MKTKVGLLIVAAMAVALTFINVATIAAEHEHNMKVGKKADVTFSTETKVGDLTLKPGRYILQHRVEGEGHFVRFTTPQGKEVGQVKCKLEPLPRKVDATMIDFNTEGGVNLITKAMVGGENVAHVF